MHSDSTDIQLSPASLCPTFTEILWGLGLFNQRWTMICGQFDGRCCSIPVQAGAGVLGLCRNEFQSQLPSSLTSWVWIVRVPDPIPPTRASSARPFHTVNLGYLNLWTTFRARGNAATAPAKLRSSEGRAGCKLCPAEPCQHGRNALARQKNKLCPGWLPAAPF